MKKYAIFIEDMEIHITLIYGDFESIDTIREEIKWLLQDDPKTEKGYVEQYPFYQANWEITGSNLPTGFDKSTILEIA